MPNRLLEEIEYKIDETNFGRWRRYGYDNGTSYHEFKSHAKWLGMPILHYTYGKNPETGRRVIAKGVIAVGRLACGIIAIGHASIGVLAVGQLAIGLAFGLGQISTGVFAIGQVAIGILFGLGQFATGYVAIGQFALGKYVLAQIGLGEHVLSMKRADQAAVEFFRTLPIIRYFLH